MRSISKNESGIALLLVVGSLVVMTMITVEFAYNAQIEYRLALRQKQRVQALYLAHSAYNLTLLQLKMNEPVQKQVNKAVEQLAKQGITLPFDTAAPICQQFPMQTGMFRLAMAGGLEGLGEGVEEGVEGEGGGEEAAGAAGLLAGMELQGVEAFLRFQGDFTSECIDESAKINLNYFYDQDPLKKVMAGSVNAYDDYKKFVMKTLQNPSYRKLFETSEITVEEAVRNIADWIDQNSNINILGGGERGGEDSQYRGIAPGQMAAKNGKLSTPLDIYRVAGVEDPWWVPVSDLFTIYGARSRRGQGQINVCRAPDEVVRGLVLRYIEGRKDLPPLKEEDAEIVSQLVTTVQEGCVGGEPDKNEIARNLDTTIAELMKVDVASQPVSPPEEEKEEEPKEEDEEGEAQEGKGEKEEENKGGSAASSKFADWITTESRFFRLKLSGQIQDTVVQIDTVMDVGEGGGSDANKWKLYYWKVY